MCSPYHAGTTIRVETTEPSAAAKLNNSQGEDGQSITIRGGLFRILPMPEGLQTIILRQRCLRVCVDGGIGGKFQEKGAFEIEERGQRWCWGGKLTGKVETIQVLFLWKTSTGVGWDSAEFVRSSGNMQEGATGQEWMKCLVLKKGQLGPQTNTPPPPNINRRFSDRSCNFDLWLLLIRLRTVWGKSIVYATQGSRPGLGSTIYSQGGLRVQSGTCGISPRSHTCTVSALL